MLTSRAGPAPRYSLRVNCRNRPRLAAFVRLLGGLDPDRDGILIFAEAGTSDPGFWVHADLVGAPSPGNECPDGARSLSVAVNRVRPPGALMGAVRAGAPLRGYEVVTLRAYRDGSGDWWLGQRSYNKKSGWSRTQPVLGPLSDAGFRLEFYAAEGGAATRPEDIARIEVMVVGRTGAAVGRPGQLRRRLVDTVVTQAALRNMWR